MRERDVWRERGSRTNMNVAGMFVNVFIHVSLRFVPGRSLSPFMCEHQPACEYLGAGASIKSSPALLTSCRHTGPFGVVLTSTSSIRARHAPSKQPDKQALLLQLGFLDDLDKVASPMGLQSALQQVPGACQNPEGLCALPGLAKEFDEDATRRVNLFLILFRSGMT